MNLPRIVCIELEVMPTAVTDFGVRDLGVVEQRRIFQQQVGDAVSGNFATTLNRKLLVTTTRAAAGLILEVVTEETAELQIVCTGDQREVVFPDVKVFAVLPRRLVPDVGVTTRAPEQRRRSAANRTVVREDRRELGSDFGLQRFRSRVGRDDDVVAGDRELELVYRFRRQRV